MMICVTNRKLCRGDFLERIRQLAAGGADVILLREKDLSPAAYTELAEKCLAICREYSTALWLNSFTGTAAALQLPVQLPLSVLQELTDADKENCLRSGHRFTVWQMRSWQKSCAQTG